MRVDDGAEAAPAGRRPVLVGYGVDESEESPAAFVAPSTGDDGGPTLAATPAVRRLAKERGIDLSTVAGSGPGGRITREDVERAAVGPAVPARSPEDAEVIPVQGIRRIIAERLTRSVRDIPQVTTFITLDATALLAFRDSFASGDARMSPLPIVVRALAETCRAHPLLNASFSAERSEILVHRSVHVGVAADTERGLLVPVVRDVQAQGIAQIAHEIAGLVSAARDGSIGPDRLTGGTVTVTNVGTFGSESGTPIIDPPQGAILALGLIEPRALVVNGSVEARPACTLALTFDHRLMDGAQAGRALRDLRDLLQQPARLESLPR